MSLIYQVLKVVTHEKVINRGILLVSAYYFPVLTFGYQLYKAIY